MLVKILFLSHRFPYPPTRGDKIRSFNMVKHLHASGHQVSVASMARSVEEAEDCEGIAEYCEDFILCRVGAFWQGLRMILRLFSRQPSSMGFFYSARLHRAVKKLLKEKDFDLIIVFSSSAAQYVSHVGHIPKLLDFCDMDSQKWLAFSGFKPWPISMGYWLEGMKLLAAEKKLAHEFDLCSCATAFETDTLESYQTGAESGVFANGVDFDFFQPSDQGYKKHNISFIGRMDYYPNEECVLSFCKNILPALRQKYPDVSFTIIGAEPPESVRALDALPGVTVTGTVDDIRPYVQQSHVMVAPLEIARGTQNKILEGMAMGVPVISSANAARGVDAVAGKHIYAACTPDDYIASISRLFEDEDERNRLALAGRERVVSHHNWPHAMQQFDDLIERCISSFAAKGP